MEGEEPFDPYLEKGREEGEKEGGKLGTQSTLVVYCSPPLLWRDSQCPLATNAHPYDGAACESHVGGAVKEHLPFIPSSQPPITSLLPSRKVKGLLLVALLSKTLLLLASRPV